MKSRSKNPVGFKFRKLSRKDNGVALVAVLLLVVLATILATSTVQEQQLAVRGVSSYMDRNQSEQYAMGGEELARQILYEDYLTGSDKDHLGESWASADLSYDFQSGEVDLQITDLQSLFNVNSLSRKNKRQSLSRKRFLNLAGALSVDPSVSEVFEDWLDEDVNVRPNGMEDFEYLLFDPPYRAGNDLTADVSEVALFAYEPALYQTLRPHLVSLPDASSHLNVNTLSAISIRSLSKQLTNEDAESIIAVRDSDDGFDSVDEFLRLPQLAGLNIVKQGLNVQSEFFEIRVIARYREHFSYLNSILYRNPADGSMRILSRDFSKIYRSLPSLFSSNKEDLGE